MPGRDLDRCRAVYPGPGRLEARVPVRAARRMADGRAPRGGAGLHGRDRPAPRPRRHPRADGLDRQPAVSRGPAPGRVTASRPAARVRSRAMRRGLLIGGGALAAVLAAAALWLAWPDLLESGEIEPAPVDTSPEQIARGEYLARAGNCIGCHTRRDGEPYAGGRAIRTPFGNVFSTNLTPDEETGLGTWTSADFWRAMHHGRSKDGRRLYPAFPYTSYTHVTREDSDAIFAFLKSLPPVRSPRIEPDLRFPYNLPLALAVWRALFFEPGGLEPDPSRSEQWNRGAYLVEGLAHCKACHSPRGRLGAIDSEQAYGGGEIPGLGWEAPPLHGGMSDGEAKDLAVLLSTGVSRRTAVTGPMAEVVFHSLQY